MNDLALAVGGFVMGFAAAVFWPEVERSLLRAVRWLGKLWRRRPDNWFRPSEGPVPSHPGNRRPQPGPRPVVGQRPSEGSHRAKQRRARFGGRSFRSRR